MKKGVFCEAVRRRLAGGDILTDLSVKDEDVAIVGNEVRAEIVNQYVNSGGDIDGQFVNTYTDYTISYDSNRDILFTDLRASIVDLDSDGGLRLVSPLKDEKNAFIIVSENFESMYNGLPTSGLGGKPYVRLEGRKIIYGNLDIDKWTDKGILIKMVPDMLDMDDDDEIKIPGAVFSSFMNAVVSTLSPQQAKLEDQVPDNRDQA